MKESMEDRIIERYLNGEMKPQEERDFRALLELDPALRLRMEAEKIVQQTLEKDREQIHHEESGSYSRFLAALATSVPAAEGALIHGSASSTSSSVAGSASTAAGAGSGAFSSGVITSLLAGSLGKGLLAVAIVATMATGVYVATPASYVEEQSDPAVLTAPAKNHPQSTTGSDSSLGSPAALPRETTRPAAAPGVDATVESGKREQLTTEPDGSVVEQPSAQTPRNLPQQGAAPAEKSEDALDAMLRSMEKDASRQIDVIESDSVAAELKIGSKKKQ